MLLRAFELAAAEQRRVRLAGLTAPTATSVPKCIKSAPSTFGDTRLNQGLKVAERKSRQKPFKHQWGSFRTIEQRASGWNELEQNIIVADIRGQDNQAELLRLKEHHAVL